MSKYYNKKMTDQGFKLKGLYLSKETTLLFNELKKKSSSHQSFDQKLAFVAKAIIRNIENENRVKPQV